ncbi:hypothetical protein LIER_04304 [Lithospermum erythrorhizon]|uniref:Uncharacterized protein n=1 Tax=Lithospermum erythrorhizon TaxID=34254 RepID=A0AAV3NY69_LITER
MGMICSGEFGTHCSKVTIKFLKHEKYREMERALPEYKAFWFVLTFSENCTAVQMNFIPVSLPGATVQAGLICTATLLPNVVAKLEKLQKGGRLL